MKKTNGVPIKIKFEHNEEHMEGEVKNIMGEIFYNHDDINKWYPLEMNYKMNIETKLYPLLIFKGIVKTKVKLSNYFSLNENRRSNKKIDEL